jgi:DNA-binding beta-propeller fold protein YncE
MAVAQFGDDDIRYELVPDWARLPAKWTLEQTSVATDSEDRVYLFNRGDHPVIVLSADGEMIDAWGEGFFGSAHGLFIDAEDALYLPNFHRHAICKFSTDGSLLMTLGTLDVPGRDDWDGDVLAAISRPVERSSQPFICPTDVAVDQHGNIFCSDGYGNARVHRFSKDGVLERSWGEPGTEPGQFHVVHGIWAHADGRVFVADRENNRVQVFTSDGEFLDVWTGFDHPCDIYISADDVVYVAEGAASSVSPVPANPASFMQLRTLTGDLIMSWSNPDGGGGHSVWIDSQGSLYVNQNKHGERLLKYVRI